VACAKTSAISGPVSSSPASGHLRLVAGILAAGAGGRLVMRLLAVTAGPDAQGRITEAEKLVGHGG